jgi:hypothetical protein
MPNRLCHSKSMPNRFHFALLNCMILILNFFWLRFAVFNIWPFKFTPGSKTIAANKNKYMILCPCYRVTVYLSSSIVLFLDIKKIITLVNKVNKGNCFKNKPDCIIDQIHFSVCKKLKCITLGKIRSFTKYLYEIF